MRRAPLILTGTLVVAAVALTGCSLFDSSPPRDSRGQVTESAVIAARDLQGGDCFSFNSSDGTVVSQVTVSPCAEEHSYRVLAQGSLSTADISTAGTLQNAVSVACSEPFAAFKEASTAEKKPKQEFLVFPESEEPDAAQLYSCIATDVAALASADEAGAGEDGAGIQNGDEATETPAP